MKRYERPAGLEHLLTVDGDARRYFGALPSYVQDLVCRSPQKISTEQELHQSAAGILHSLHD